MEMWMREPVRAFGVAGRSVRSLPGNNRVARWLLCCVLCAGCAWAQAPPQPDLSQLDLEDLVKLQVDAVYGASKFLRKVAGAPASLTTAFVEPSQKDGYRALALALLSVASFDVIDGGNDRYVG